MNGRERIIETINHREPDKLAIDFGGMRSTGIQMDAYIALKKYLKVETGLPKMYDIFQQLAEPEMAVLDIMGGDVVQAGRLAPTWGLRLSEWKPWKNFSGNEFLVPKDFNPETDEEGNLFIRWNGQIWAKMPKGGYYFDQVFQPYAQAETYADIDAIPISKITEEELDYIEAQCRTLYETTDKAILFAFGGNIFENGQVNWGYEKFFMDLLLNQELVHYWLSKVTEVYLHDLEKILGRIGQYIQVIQFGDDLGTQENLQISLDLYREMIKPYQQKQFAYVRNNYPHVKVFLHSCGAISEIIPDLIDAGVEILNPVQISAKGMDPAWLKKEFGKEVTFWGGGANMQYTVPNQNVDKIAQETKELIDIFRPGGGFVFTQVHNIQANVPPEKIMAIYQAALEVRNKA